MSLITNNLDKSIAYIDQIKILIAKYPHTYFSIINKNKNFKYLLDWINSQTPLLQDNFYKLSTKIYWILHDIKTFDDIQCKCKTCGKPFIHYNVKINTGYPSFCSGKKGNNCSQLNKLVQEKTKQTCFKKYGVTSYTKTQECKDKTKKSFIEHYGVDNNMKCEEGLKEYTDAMMKKHGVKFCAQSAKIRRKQGKRYKFNDLKFDSLPELALYIYLKDNNIKFEYQPNIKLIYIYNNKEHYYIPDFIINNKLVEIKGDHFVKSDGKWQCPWDHRLDALFEAKHKCAIENNVVILLKSDYIKYIKYVEVKYGKSYLKQFKNSNNVY